MNKWTLIASGGGFDFWERNNFVYRNKTEDREQRDTQGNPIGLRWECSIATWQQFRKSAFAWVNDIKGEPKP
jgi:hypothetical protein